MPIRIALILGTTRKSNESSKVATFLRSLLEANAEIHVDFLDLGIAGFPILEERLANLDDPPAALVEWNDILRAAHGIVIVAPEYKNGYPGSLKNFLDYLPQGAFRYKPVAITTVSSGPLGGVNCLAQLRLVCLAMAGIPIPDHLRIPFVKECFPGDGSRPDAEIKSKSKRFLAEHLKYVTACMEIERE